jgi:hypothetical protein
VYLTWHIMYGTVSYSCLSAQIHITFYVDCHCYIYYTNSTGPYCRLVNKYVLYINVETPICTAYTVSRLPLSDLRSAIGGGKRVHTRHAFTVVNHWV